MYDIIRLSRWCEPQANIKSLGASHQKSMAGGWFQCSKQVSALICEAHNQQNCTSYVPQKHVQIVQFCCCTPHGVRQIEIFTGLYRKERKSAVAPRMGCVRLKYPSYPSPYKRVAPRMGCVRLKCSAMCCCCWLCSLHPARGALIEIRFRSWICLGRTSRTPHGVR